MFNQDTRLLMAAIEGILDGCYSAYLFSAVFLTFNRLWGMLRTNRKRSVFTRALKLVWLFSKWPALVFLILDPFFHFVLDQKMDFWFWLFEALGFYNWWYYRNMGDDDDWQKLKKKLRDKVAVLRGKLTVVPEPA